MTISNAWTASWGTFPFCLPFRKLFNSRRLTDAANWILTYKYSKKNVGNLLLCKSTYKITKKIPCCIVTLHWISHIWVSLSVSPLHNQQFTFFFLHFHKISIKGMRHMNDHQNSKGTIYVHSKMIFYVMISHIWVSLSVSPLHNQQFLFFSNISMKYPSKACTTKRITNMCTLKWHFYIMI